MLIKDIEYGKTAACGIADFDREIGELVLEWIQVLPEYRRRGLGKMLVNELLCRMGNRAKFATVSGRADSPSNPEALYRKCGFAGNDVWHVLHRK
ncbi:MAG: GNAT family N-acetyltransferase [Oscillospiraceae bacterium]